MYKDYVFVLDQRYKFTYEPFHGNGHNIQAHSVLTIDNAAVFQCSKH